MGDLKEAVVMHQGGAGGGDLDLEGADGEYERLTAAKSRDSVSVSVSVRELSRESAPTPAFTPMPTPARTTSTAASGDHSASDLRVPLLETDEV